MQEIACMAQLCARDFSDDKDDKRPYRGLAKAK
jgi:hypothetical protein